MAKVKLSMCVERIPYGPGVPTERQGLLLARICVSFVGGNSYDVSLLSNRQDEFEEGHVASMFRHMERLTNRDPPILVPDGYDLRPGAINRV